ncbi:unnamed protein product [Clonostachys rosea f. rosea IK726]|uniref:Uncharacterized protein n=1 Tax=Clonostachys rosea f. rosea IK726 TaxID=1349383 RepID=A0ACA9UW01_BIOOC|nr:unnamed protein product [Clonostachys rosea f. rosea IK726]
MGAGSHQERTGRDCTPPLHSATQAIHADDDLERHGAMPADLNSHHYSRISAPTTTRLEVVLTQIIGQPSITYASGLAAFHALMIMLNPKKIFMDDVYHGCQKVVDIMARLTGLEKHSLDQLERLGPRDAYDLGFYKKRAEAAGAYLVVDSTFGPPPLQDPFAFGADVVLHSGTKYFGGHSDMLCGILSVSQSHVDEGWLDQLRNERSTIGSVMGSLEGWLGLRSIRTLQLRVERQSANAVALVAWLHLLAQDEASIAAKTILRVTHASLQEDALAAGWLQKQMPGGYGPVFSILFHEAKDAQRLPSFLHLFNHATSLGGVESLIEWRAMTDAGADRRLVRVSVGVEDLRDLQNDLLQGLTSLVGQP